MCLLFYLAGVATGYLTWRLVSAPYLWDAQEEAKSWQKQWAIAKSEIDALKGLND